MLPSSSSHDGTRYGDRNSILRSEVFISESAKSIFSTKRPNLFIREFCRPLALSTGGKMRSATGVMIISPGLSSARISILDIFLLGASAEMVGIDANSIVARVKTHRLWINSTNNKKGHAMRAEGAPLQFEFPVSKFVPSNCPQPALTERGVVRMDRAVPVDVRPEASGISFRDGIEWHKKTARTVRSRAALSAHAKIGKSRRVPDRTANATKLPTRKDFAT